MKKLLILAATACLALSTVTFAEDPMVNPSEPSTPSAKESPIVMADASDSMNKSTMTSKQDMDKSNMNKSDDAMSSDDNKKMKHKKHKKHHHKKCHA